jgi:deoxyribodipyrimidine photo-lyase
MTHKIGIHIFRRDLRLNDNMALNLLTKQVDIVVPIFILDPQQILLTPHNKNYFSSSAVQFICESLDDLNNQLKLHKSQLFLFMDKPENVISQIIKSLTIHSVSFNLDFSPYAIKRDNKIIDICTQSNINVITCDNDMSLLPTDLMLNPKQTKQGVKHPYKLFSGFYANALLHSVNKPKKLVKTKFITKLSIKKLYPINKLSTLYQVNELLDQRGGLVSCMEKIKLLKNQKKYNMMRDRLDYSTTHLSAYLNMGIISVRELYWLFRSKLGTNTQLLKQLWWRDFYLCVLRFVPNATSYKKYIDPRFDKIKWRKPIEFRKEFKAMWYSRTGFLLIDAGMRELQTTGFLHNRCRMILAVFANKYLQINMLEPKYGSHAWYSKLLVDAIGQSQNKLNHHWSLDFDLSGRRFGVGISGRPMNISNKEIRKYDPDCKYIKKWLPHLSEVDNKDLYSWDEIRSLKYNKIHPAPMFDQYDRYKEWVSKTRDL